MFYVVGGLEENEILLYNVVLAVRDSLNLLLKYVVLNLHSLFLPVLLERGLWRSLHMVMHALLSHSSSLRPLTDTVERNQKLKRQTYNHRELRSSLISYR